MMDWVKRSGRGLVVATALAATMALTSPNAADAGGISPGAAVGIGLGSFALGTALGSGAAYGYPGYGYGYGYAPAPAYYYPPAPAYYPRSCWDPYYHRYYAC